MAEDQTAADEAVRDPLWMAAMQVASRGISVIETDLVARESALGQVTLIRDQARSTDADDPWRQGDALVSALQPYPHLRGAFTRLKGGAEGEVKLDTIREALDRYVLSMEEDVAARRRAQRAWLALTKAIDANDASAAAHGLRSEPSKAITASYPELERPLERIRIAAERATAGRATSLRAAISEYCAKSHWTLEEADHRLVINGLLVVDVADDRTTVQSRQVGSVRWSVVQPVLEAENERVWGRARREADNFAVALVDALEAAESSSGAKRYVQLKEVYSSLASRLPKESGRLASYYRDEFSADLSVAIAQASPVRTQLELSAARDPRLNFPVVLPDGSVARYGYARLRPRT